MHGQQSIKNACKCVRGSVHVLSCRINWWDIYHFQ